MFLYDEHYANIVTGITKIYNNNINNKMSTNKNYV